MSGARAGLRLGAALLALAVGGRLAHGAPSGGAAGAIGAASHNGGGGPGADSDTAARRADDGDASDPAASRPLVLVFTPATAGPLAGRLEAELGAVGMSVRRIVVADETTFAELAPLVADAGARGAIRVSGGSFGAEVWIPDPRTGRAALRQALSSESAQGMESVIVPRTVEFLRASLLPAAPPAPPEPRPEPASVAPPPVAIAAPPGAAAPAAGARLRIAAAPALVLSPGGLGAFASAAFTLGLRLGRRTGLEATALLPFSTPALDTPEGTIRVSVTLAGLGAYARPIDGRRWAVDVAAGLLAASVRADGQARGPNVGSTTSLLGFAPYARAGAGLAITSWLSARADLIGGSVLRRVAITVADESSAREVATWGRPFATALLGLQAGWL